MTRTMDEIRQFLAATGAVQDPLLQKLRAVGDYEAYRAAMMPQVRRADLLVRSARTTRPPGTRTKSDEELRILIECFNRRRRTLHDAGIVVQTGPRTWRVCTTGS